MACMIVLIPIVTLHGLGSVCKELAAVLQDTFASVKRLLTVRFSAKILSSPPCMRSRDRSVPVTEILR